MTNSYVIFTILIILVFIIISLIHKCYSLSSEYAELLDERRNNTNNTTRSKFDKLIDGLTAIQKTGAGSSTETVSKEEFYQTVVDYACSLINAKRGSLMIHDSKKDELVIVAARNITSHTVLSTTIKSGEGVAGRAFMTGEVIFVATPKQNTLYTDYKGAETENDPFVSLPLKVKDKPFGVLNLHLPTPDASFTEYELRFLNLLVGEASSMLENISLYENMDSFYREMVQTLVRVIGSNNPQWAKEAEISAKKAKRLAQELNIDEATQKNIEYAALLCNIGKVGLNTDILTKPGKLTKEEYKELMQHPFLSYQILAPIRFLSPVAQIVLFHQECFNGSGYPDGLRGNQIPIGSRILSVVGAWEAMTRERPYRDTMSFEQAEVELKRGMEIQFDPKVVNTFLKLEKAGWPTRY